MTGSLALRDVQCARGERMLFAPVSMQVRRGQMLRVEGANGSGKTSLLRTLAGLSQPAGGRVLWEGQPAQTIARDEWAAKIVYVGHAPALKHDLSAIENLQALCGLSGSRVSHVECAALLTKLGLASCMRLAARSLSQGQRKRVGLARIVLRTEALCWVLDEPFNALDDSASRWLQDTLHAHLQRGGIAVLASHHARAWDVAPDEVRIVLEPAVVAPYRLDDSAGLSRHADRRGVAAATM